MRTFIIKTLNLVLILGILFVYQQHALARETKVKSYEKEAALASQAWKEIENGDGDGQDTDSYSDGTHTGSGFGFGGNITVEVKVEKGKIISAKILSAENETPKYLKEAEKILEDVVAEQTWKVDTVSGATLSSNGILEGVQNALEE